MGYIRAEEILPSNIIELIQDYIDGESIYIPRKESNKKQWGSRTLIRQELTGLMMVNISMQKMQTYLQSDNIRKGKKGFVTNRAIYRLYRKR